MDETVEKYRLICWRQVFREKEKAVCDTCREKCVEEVKKFLTSD